MKKMKVATSNTYDKNGNKLTETNWLGNTTTYVYDPLNRVIEKIDANGKTIEKLEYNINDTQSKSIDVIGVATYESYDEVGNTASKTDGKGNVTTYQYKVGNKVSKKISSGDNEETYTYYGDGSLKTKIDRNGVVAEYIYDIFGRKIEKK